MALTERLALIVDARVDGAVRDIKSLAKESSRTDDEAKKLEARGKAIGTAWKVGVGVAAGVALAKMAQLSKEAVQDASALGETVNKVGVVFEDQAAKVLAFGESAASSIGQSKQQALSAAATFGQFFDAAGMATEAGADMSLVMVKLASDMASFNDADPSEVLDNLRSGLSGETEPLRKFGVFLNEAAVAAKAADLGLEGVNGKLTDGEKIQARYALIMEQTAKAQGDFARTSDSLANKQREAAALAENASAALGEGLLPAQLALTNAFVDAAPAITTVAQATGGMVKAFTDLPGPLQAVLAASTLAGGGFLILGPRIADTREAMKELGAEAPRTTRALRGMAIASAIATSVIALDAALKGLGESAADSLPGTEVLTGKLLDLSNGKIGDLGGEFDDLGRTLRAMDSDISPNFLSGIIELPDRLIPGIQSSSEAADKGRAQIQALDAALSNLASTGGAPAAKAAFEDLARAQGLTAQEQEILAANLPQYKEALAGAANQTKILAKETDAAAKSTERAEKRQELLAEKLRESRQAARSTGNEFVNLGDSLDDNEVSLKGWLREMEKSARALRDFEDNARKAARRGLHEGLIAALQEAGPEGAMRMRQLANATDAEIKRASAAWHQGRDAVNDYTSAVGGVPKAKTTRLDVIVDTSALDTLQYRLNRLSQGYQVPVKTLAQPRAAGGPVTRGETYLVGEEGPEIFVPRESGTIIPNGALGRSSGGTRLTDDLVMTYAKSLDKAGRMTEKHAAKLLESADQIRDGIASKIRNLKQERAGIAGSFASSFGQNVFGSEANSVSGILSLAGKQASDALAVNQAVQALIGKGVSEGVLKDLLSGGQAGFDQIKLLAGADKAQLAEFNKLTQIADSNLLKAGGLVGGALLNDDIAAAQRDQKAVERITKALEDALRKHDENTTVVVQIGEEKILTVLRRLKRNMREELGL